MAGANNKAMKAAGFKPAGIKVIRSTGGAGLSIRSAISHAQQHGVAIPAKAAEHAPTGWQKAAERSGMTGWQKAAAGATTAADHAASQAAFDARRAAKAEERKTAMLAARRSRVAGALGAASKGMMAARKAAAKPAMSALDRYLQQVKTEARAKERGELSDMTATVRDNMAAGRSALAGSAKPRGGLERTVVRGFMGGKTSVQNVRPIAKSGDFFVHKSGGFGSGYGVTHRPSGTTIYQSHSVSAARAAMDGMAKTGSKILSRIENGDMRAAKALRRYQRGLSSAKFYNAAFAKYDKRA